VVELEARVSQVQPRPSVPGEMPKPKPRSRASASSDASPSAATTAVSTITLRIGAFPDRAGSAADGRASSCCGASLSYADPYLLHLASIAASVRRARWWFASYARLLAGLHGRFAAACTRRKPGHGSIRTWGRAWLAKQLKRARRPRSRARDEG
jgi:hypothetical protein